MAVLMGAVFIPGARAAGSDSPGACSTVPLFEAGRAVNAVCVEQRDANVTVLNLSDDWVPAIFTETPGRPQSYRGTFIALANERFGEGREWDAARREDGAFYAWARSHVARSTWQSIKRSLKAAARAGRRVARLGGRIM